LLKALEKGIDSVFSSTVKKPPQAGRAYRMHATITGCVIMTTAVEAFRDALAALLSTFAECPSLIR